MNEFKVIQVMNEAKIEILKDKEEKYLLNQKIQEYLKDEAFFFKIDKTNAYKILQEVGVKKDLIEEVYQKLIDQTIFYDLLNKGKIKSNDQSIIIKYDSYR